LNGVAFSLNLNDSNSDFKSTPLFGVNVSETVQYRDILIMKY